MEVIFAFAIIILCALILLKSADLIVDSAVFLARRFNLSDFSIGFFVLGLATTTPEFFIGINAAIDNRPQLSLGNLIGASIVLLTLIVGVNAVINRGVNFVHSFTKRDLILTSFVVISPLLFILDGMLSQNDGLFLVILYLVFFKVMNKRQSFTSHIEQSLKNGKSHILNRLFLTLLGVFSLFIASRFLVDSAELISLRLELPIVLLGLLLVALGTNLPELTVLFRSTKVHHRQISTGNVLGSVAANTAVLGIVAMLRPIHIEAPVRVFFSFGILFLALLIFNAFFVNDKRISRLEGFGLISLYIIFVVTELALHNNL